MTSVSSSILHSLNPAQQMAVTHSGGPAMVLAGAGSGKTTVLTHRVAWLIAEQNVLPEAILLVTFTNKAASEMKERVHTLTGHHLPLSGTFHSICARILRKDGHLVGLRPGFSIFDTDDQLSLLKKIYKANSWSVKDFNPKSVLGTISTAKNELVSWQEYDQKSYGHYQEHVAKAYQLYQKHLHENQAVDFDDLMLKTIELFTKNPDALKKYQDLLSHVLVDEYQDTNKAQYELTKFLAAPQNNLYVVGDFSQSIYSWRGADYRNMLMLKTDFPELKEYRLEQNYRSTQTILDAATTVISQNTSHPVLQLWTENKDTDTISVYEAEHAGDEAKQVVRWIRQLSVETDLSEMAILYRTNAQSRAFEEAFVTSAIPYKVIGGMKFYERKEIKDSLAYLRAVANPSDTISLQRLEKNGKRKFSAFMTWKEANIDDKLIPQLAPAPLLKEIFEITGFLKQFDSKDPEDLSRIENVQELLAVADQFSSLIQFLENVSLVQNDFVNDTSESSNQKMITLMSLHAAKGLEFGVVFLVGMEEGLMPHSRAFLDKDQLEEERRLCYVGITRAKRKLFLSYARSRALYGSTNNALRSRFITDIPKKLLTLSAAAQYGGSSYASSGSNPAYGQIPRNPWAYTKGNSGHHQKPASKERRVVPLDDDSLDAVLSGDLDIDAFLDS